MLFIKEFVEITDVMVPHAVVYLSVRWRSCCLLAWLLLYAFAMVILTTVATRTL